MTTYINSLNMAEFVLLLITVFAAVVQLFILLAYVFRPVGLVWASLWPGLAAIIGTVVLFASTR